MVRKVRVISSFYLPIRFPLYATVLAALIPSFISSNSHRYQRTYDGACNQGSI